MKDYYRILNIEPDASREEIRSAFRALARTHHPDTKGPGKISDTTRFIEIRQAYETLMETATRTRYDKRRETFMKNYSFNKTPAKPAFNSDRSKESYKHQNVAKSSDHHIQFKARLLNQPKEANPLDRVLRVTIPLEQSLVSKTCKIRIPDSRTPFKSEISWRVQLPGKLYPDAILCVHGLGRQSNAMSQRGDLILKVNFAPHPHFRLINGQLHANTDVMPWQAALGGKISVQTLEDKKDILLTPNRQLPYMNCLKGMGLYQQNGLRGDLWYNLRIKIPQAPSWRARRLWAELAEEYRHSENKNSSHPFSR